ncbi:hypothetical protein INR49_019011 [Caranx melampygus]|nr:hypothetical protein INR49_019011 [Caranx melampygus]
MTDSLHHYQQHNLLSRHGGADLLKERLQAITVSTSSSLVLTQGSHVAKLSEAKLTVSSSASPSSSSSSV